MGIRFQCYFYGKKVKLYTDQQAIEPPMNKLMQQTIQRKINALLGPTRPLWYRDTTYCGKQFEIYILLQPQSGWGSHAGRWKRCGIRIRNCYTMRTSKTNFEIRTIIRRATKWQQTHNRDKEWHIPEPNWETKQLIATEYNFRQRKDVNKTTQNKKSSPGQSKISESNSNCWPKLNSSPIQRNFSSKSGSYRHGPKKLLPLGRDMRDHGDNTETEQRSRHAGS